MFGCRLNLKILMVLFYIALGLPVAATLLEGFSLMLNAFGDHGCSEIFRRLAICTGLIWVADLVALLLGVSYSYICDTKKNESADRSESGDPN